MSVEDGKRGGPYSRRSKKVLKQKKKAEERLSAGISRDGDVRETAAEVGQTSYDEPNKKKKKNKKQKRNKNHTNKKKKKKKKKKQGRGLPLCQKFYEEGLLCN